MPLNTEDYRQAPGGIGPLAAQWHDKPHRLVYDLCAEVERLRAEVVDILSVEVVDDDREDADGR